MKYLLRYITAKDEGIWLRRTGQMFKDAVTVRELVAKTELNPVRRAALARARKQIRKTDA